MPTLMFDPECMHRAVLNVITNAILMPAATAKTAASKSPLNTATPSGWPASPSSTMAAASRRTTLKKSSPSSSRRKGSRGTGLGLPVSQKILKEHGGRIRVESKLGEGSRFTLEFPATSPPTAGTSTGSIAHVRGSTTIDPIPADSSHA